MTDMRTEYARTLIEIGKTNPDVVVLGADTTDSLKTLRFGKQFPNRFFNVGIAEGNLVTVSAGLAASGKTPFASTYAIFLPGRAVDQIRNNVAYPSSAPDKKGLNVKLVVSHGGLSVGPDGGSHQQLEDIAIMRAIPNMRVFIPADTATVSALTRLMSNKYGPFYMRMARSKTPLLYQTSEFHIGKAITVLDGSDCTIAACGITVYMALEAAKILRREYDISCRVLDMFCVKPLDGHALEKAARQTGCIVTTEEHNILGGMGSAVAESVSETYPVPITRIGARDAFGESARDAEVPLLLEKHGITSFNMVKQARNQVMARGASQT